MTSWSIAPSLVVGYLGRFLSSGAAACDGRDARDWLTELATVGSVSPWWCCAWRLWYRVDIAEAKLNYSIQMGHVFCRFPHATAMDNFNTLSLTYLHRLSYLVFLGAWIVFYFSQQFVHYECRALLYSCA